MNKAQKTRRLVSNFDLRLSWLFSPDTVSVETQPCGDIRYTIQNAKNGQIQLLVTSDIKRGVPPHIDVFGRFENGSDYFKDANPHTGKYNFFGLDQEGIDHYLKNVLAILSPFPEAAA